METVDEIIIHCSATKEGQDFRANDIRSWHRQRGFADIGYHAVVCIDGKIERGRDYAMVGAHCTQQRKNYTSIGICYVGGLDAKKKPCDTRNEKQKEALYMLISALCRKYKIKRVRGHRDYAAKACPCFDAAAEYQCIADKYEALREIRSETK